MSGLPDDRVAVVTGASAGIGGATSARLLEDGWRVVGIDVDASGFNTVASDHPDLTGVVEGTVAERGAHEEAVMKARELGTLCGWVNNAGIENETHAHDFTDEAWDAIMDVNCRGVAYGCSAAVGAYLADGVKGSIVNVSSIRAIVSFVGAFAYEASKGAVDMMTRSVAVEYGPHGIRCNGVRPGAILTPMMEKTDLCDATGEGREAIIKSIGKLHPLEHRVGMPEEVADTTAFLLSDQARLINGALVNVDGGATARCFPSD